MNLAAIDFIRRRGQPAMGWLLLAIGVAASIGSSVSAWPTMQALIRGRGEVRDQADAPITSTLAPVTSTPAHSLIFFEDPRWRRAAQTLRWPWLESLAAIEQTAKPPVFLLALRSTAEIGQLDVDGVASDLDSVLGFVEALQAQPPFSDTRLLAHELLPDATGRLVVHFSLRTRWVTAP